MKHRERWIVYPALAVLAAVLLLRPPTAVADAPPDGAFGVLTVREVRLVNGTGMSMLRLYANAKGGGIMVTNTDGRDIAYFGTDVDEGSGRSYIASKEGVRTVEIAHGTGGGLLSTNSPDGTRVAYLGAASDTTGLLFVTSKTGVRAVELGTGDRGGFMLANTPEGKLVTYLGAASDNGIGLLSLSRTDGERRAYVTASGWIGVLKDDGKEGVQIGIDAKGGVVRTFDAAGSYTELPSSR